MVIGAHDCREAGRCCPALGRVGFTVIEECVSNPSSAEFRQKHTLAEIEQGADIDSRESLCMSYG